MGHGAEIKALRLEFGSQGYDLGLKAGIWALKLELGQYNWGWDLGDEAGILARGGAKKEEEKEKEEITPYIKA